MTPWRRALLVVLVVASCIGCDQATKAAAVEHLPRGEVLSLASDTLRLQYAENRGAFLGLGERLPDRWRPWLLTWSVGAVLAGLLAYLLAARAPRSWLALSLICGGGLGNLADRVLRDGTVVDFLVVGVGPVRTGIFNVADLAITTGAVALLVAGLVGRERSDEPAAPPPAG
jgi:signal peptidase II